ncbi:MAG: NUDIX domain-containing protein [Dehalococcoidia bacterium]|nr:NUDIX domain-containing protein [Dehalococcoidia bacterium]
MGALIEDRKGRILLVRHKPERGGFWQGKWICPGGELELGEEIGAGIKREIKEETNLEIDLVKALAPFDRIVKSAQGVNLHVVYIDYIANLAGGELEVASDVGEALWVEKDKLGSLWEELHEDTKKLLELAGMV